MQWLGDVAVGRDNNLNLIRMIAASAVLVSHAFPITLGQGASEPLEHLLGFSLGSFAVLLFFVISGFLIAGSFENSRSLPRFIWARILRLAPGLFVSLVLVAFVMALLVTTLSVTEYLSLPDPYLFVVKNLSLVFMVYDLPGVFTELPYPAVEGSIWTLFYEVACYGGIFVLGIIGILRRKSLVSLLFLGFAILAALFGDQVEALPVRLQPIFELGMPFAVGTLFWVWREKLPLSLIGVLISILAVIALAKTPLYHTAFCLAAGYTVFWLAYIPDGFVRAYNRLGDYSYGIYIYAFPLQGLFVWLLGPQTPLENMLYSFLPTLALSVLSWHLIEKPAMALKAPLSAWFENFGRKSQTS